MELLSTQLYKIIKYRKHRTTIDYFDYERIYGYDFLTYSKSFEDVLNYLSKNKEKNIEFLKCLNECVNKNNFDYTKPLSKLDRHKVVYMANKFNKIDDYINECEKKLLENLKRKNLEEFYNLPITNLGYNSYINNLLFSLNIFNIGNLFYMEPFLNKIDKNICKIIYTKANSIRYKLYNIYPFYPKHIPITLVIDTDYKRYDELRRKNIYTLEDLTTYKTLNRIKKLKKTYTN